jgi:hypothetical protein
MIRQVKHIGHDYIIIDNLLKVKDIEMSFQVQINVTKLTQEEINQVHKIVNIAFNRNINFNTKPKHPQKKSWWRFW